MNPEKTKFTKEMKNLKKSFKHPSVVISILKKRVSSGIYPHYFLDMLETMRKAKKCKKKSTARMKFSNNAKLKNFIFNLFNRVCQECGSKRFLETHHIKPINTHPELAIEASNLTLLCKDCHIDIDKKLSPTLPQKD